MTKNCIAYFEASKYREIIKSWADQDLPTDQQIEERISADYKKGIISIPTMIEIADQFFTNVSAKKSVNKNVV